MKKILKWGFTLLLVLSMLLVFAGGCTPAAEEDGAGEAEEGEADEAEADAGEEEAEGAAEE